MTSPALAQLIEQFERVRREPRCAASLLVMPAVLTALAAGEPVSPEELGRVLDIPPHLAGDTLAFICPPAEFDAERRLTGLGLTLHPTAHEVSLEGSKRTLYAWCALDALLVPVLLGAQGQVTSSCQRTGQTVSVSFGPSAVDVQPPGAVVSVVVDADPAGRRSASCDRQHFFVSEEATTGWSSGDARVLVVPVATAFEALRRLVTRAAHRADDHVDIGDLFELLLPVMVGDESEETQCRLIERRHSPSPDAPPPRPGDMWWDARLEGWLDSEAHRARGRGPHLVVSLPNGWEWDLDGPMTNGPGWYRVGAPPSVTATPSIIAGDYHGVLVKGKLYPLPSNGDGA